MSRWTFALDRAEWYRLSGLAAAIGLLHAAG